MHAYGLWEFVVMLCVWLYDYFKWFLHFWTIPVQGTDICFHDIESFWIIERFMI